MDKASRGVLTCKLGWDHDKVIGVTGGGFAAAARVTGAVQEASSLGWGRERLLQLLRFPQGLWPQRDSAWNTSSQSIPPPFLWPGIRGDVWMRLPQCPSRGHWGAHPLPRRSEWPEQQQGTRHKAQRTLQPPEGTDRSILTMPPAPQKKMCSVCPPTPPPAPMRFQGSRRAAHRRRGQVGRGATAGAAAGT